MGQVVSSVDAVRPYNVDPKRFTVEKFQCCLNEGDQTRTAEKILPVSNTVLLNTNFDAKNNELVSKRVDQKPLTLVQDPQSGLIILQLPYQPSLSLKFCIKIALIPGNEQYKLVFAHAGSPRELGQVIEQRQLGNWVDVGIWTEPQHPVMENFDFMFVWDAQDDKPGGQPIHFAFFFDGVAPQLVAGAAVWVSERPMSDSHMLYEPIQTPVRSSAITQAFNALPLGASPSSSLPLTQTPRNINSLPGSNTLSASNLLSTFNSAPDSISTPTLQTPINTIMNTSAITNTSTSSPIPVQTNRSAPDYMPYSVPIQGSKNPSAARPGPEHQFPTEDGPQFRSAIVYMERRIHSLRVRVKQVLKRSLMCRERLEALIEAVQWLGSGMQDAAHFECPGFMPIAAWFNPKAEGGLNATQRQRKVSLNELKTRVIEPLQRFYDYDIKPFEQRKRDFEEKSNQFYSWTSRYLANRKEGRRGKAGETADVKFGVKKRKFDVARLDYFTYLNDLTIGLKQQVLLQLFALAAQSLTDSHIALGRELSSRTQPELDEIVKDIKSAAREWEAYRQENMQYRRSMVEDCDNSDPSEPIGIDRIGSPELAGQNITALTEAPRNYKEGLLWASSRPGGHQDAQVSNKQALQNLKWHKYWVVLDGSSLREFTNWKQSVVDLHNEPINLLVAGVREARSKDRRFCFEVVTPQYKRVYQATSEDDVRSWIAAINKSISTLLEASDEQQSYFTEGQLHRDPNSPNSDPGDIYSANNAASPIKINNSQAVTSPINSHNFALSPSATTGMSNAAASYISPLSPRSGGIAVPVSNGTTSKKHSNDSSTEHSPRSDRIEKLTRKLSMKSGSDRPRVPPITTSFQKINSHAPVPQLVTSPQALQNPVYTLSSSPLSDDLIRQLQRKPSNKVCAECRSSQGVEWVSINLLIILCIECSGAHRSLGSHISKIRSLTLDVSAFNPSLRAALVAVSNDVINEIWEAKLPPGRRLARDSNGSARTKYVTEKYIEKQYIQELEKPNALLRKAILDQDIQRICAALASRANPNGSSDADEPMLIHALRSASPSDVTFPSAELLIRNGATIPPLGAYLGLSSAAETFLASKHN